MAELIFLDTFYMFICIFLQAVGSSTIGSCNCSISIYQILCGNDLQPSQHQFFADFDSLGDLQLNFSRYTPHVFHMTGCVFDVISGQPFNNFGTLKRIQISDNHIPQLTPLVFAGLESLQLLNFQNNRMTGVHPDLFQRLSQLMTLDLSGNELTRIPDGLFRKNRMLRKLILKENKLTSLGEHSFEGAEELEELDLSMNNLQSISPGLFTKMKNLMALSLANNKLDVFPESLSHLTDLLHLDLSQNQLLNIPDNVFLETKRLRVLDLSHNLIDILGESVFEGLNNAEALILSNNRLRQFPKRSLRKFTSIYKLDLSNNSLSQLPPFGLAGIRVDTVILSYNNLSQINSTAFKDISRESSLSLDLSHNRIEYLTVVMFEDLVTLLDNFRVDLSENQIRCNCGMKRFYEWAALQQESKGFSSIKCQHPIGIRNMLLTKLSSHDNLICVPPYISSNIKELWATDGGNILIPCPNTGEPKPHVSWFFNGNKISNTSLTTILDDGSLVISGVLSTHFGSWRCLASNLAGEATSAVTLQVSSCSFVTNTHLVASLILCLISVVLLITSITLWIGLKRRREQPTSYTDSFELTKQDTTTKCSPPAILAPTVDYTIPEFLCSTKNEDKKLNSMENGTSENKSDAHA